jgi:hypothetical protein
MSLIWSSCRRAFSVAVLAASCPLLVPAEAAAGTTPTFAFPANKVVSLSAARASFTTPADGRLRGQDFAATVTGVSWPDQIGVGPSEQEALAGHRLVVFTLDLSEDTSDLSPSGSDPAVTAALAVGNSTLSVPLSTINAAIGDSPSPDPWVSGTGEFAAAVPNHAHDVDLVLSQGSFSQSFNLWTLSRVPPAPIVLYRDSQLPTVADTTPESTTLSLSNPSDGSTGPALVTLGSVTLGYFGPSGSQSSLSSVDQAVLSVVLNAQYPTNPNQVSGVVDYLGAQMPVPASLLTFTPTGLAPIPAALSDAGDTHGQGNDDDGLFDGTYTFVVPSALTTGTLTIAAGAFSGAEFGFSATSATVDITAPQTLVVHFTPLTKTAKQAKAPWDSAPLPPTAAVGTTSLARIAPATSSGLPIWLAVLLVVLVAGGVVLVQRRKRRVRLMVPATAGGVTGPTPTAATITEAQRTASLPVQEPQPIVTDAVIATDAVVVNVIGPVQTLGHRASDRRIIEGLLVYLTFHDDRPRPAEQIRLALWPTGGSHDEVNRKTFLNYLSALRQSIGAEHLPDAVGAGGYLIKGVQSDWATFQRLCRQADKGERGAAMALRTEALALVRGMPFAGATEDHYDWVRDEHLDTIITVAVATCAMKLATDHMGDRDFVATEAAARSGLLGAPDDFGLWQIGAQAIEGRGDTTALRRWMADAARHLEPSDIARIHDSLGSHLGPDE